ncbi:iron-sulfur cluster assembly scaffold protein [Balneolales bacterium ANBcel1]|nr:iron-sulfur cluster assembly scaffold protein [Balneolales bacterium ANBcel1]
MLIDHYKNPRNRGVVDLPDLRHEAVNRKCGDRVLITAKRSGDHLPEIRFEGSGCFYCLASASVGCSTLSGSSIHEIRRNTGSFRSWLRDRSGAEEPKRPEWAALGEVKQFPMRIDCVDLFWKGLEEMLEKTTGGDG